MYDALAGKRAGLTEQDGTYTAVPANRERRVSKGGVRSIGTGSSTTHAWSPALYRTAALNGALR